MKQPRRLQWKDINVQQFLDIYRLSITPDLDEMTRLERAVCILFDRTEKQLDEMSMGEFTNLSSQVAFVLTEPIPGKASRVIKANGRRYWVIYSPSKLRHRQYVEVLHFGDKPVDNMHLILASIVNPVTWYGRKLKNQADQHEAIASDLLHARVQDVYHSAVFFCKLYVNLISNIRGFLEQEMLKQGKAETKEEASQMITDLINAMVGFIPPKNFRILKV